MSTTATALAKTVIKYLESTHQLDLLGSVVNELRRSSAYQNSQNHVVVTSAISLDPAELQAIKHYLDQSLDSPYELETVLDPSLVAGFTLVLNDTLIDASLLGKINSVHKQLTTKD